MLSPTFSGSVGLVMTLPGILYRNYESLGRLLTSLKNHRDGCFAFHITDTVPEMVNISTCRED